MQQTVLVALVTGVLTATAALTASWLSSRSMIRAAELNIRFSSARASQFNGSLVGFAVSPTITDRTSGQALSGRFRPVC
jgi:hypothetical protein